MKKQLVAVTAAAALALSFTGCGKDKSAVKIDTDGADYITLSIGQEITLGAEAKKGEVITWSSSDTDIANITSDGRLSGSANGVAVITAKTASGYDHVGVVVGNGVNGSIYIPSGSGESGTGTGGAPVFNGVSTAEKITLTLNGQDVDETLIMANGDSPTFRVNIIPSDCDDPLTFTSSDTSVAEVNSDGKVTPVSRGTVIITATAPNGVSDDFKVFVR